MEDYYKYNRAYYIRFTKIDSDTYFRNYISPNFAKILDEAIDTAIAIEENGNGNDCMIMFLEDIKIDEFICFCEEENLIEKHEDITRNLLIHNNLEDVILKMLHSNEFEEQFTQFFKKNVTLDSILDKIQINGEDSLSEFELNFLQDEESKIKENDI